MIRQVVVLSKEPPGGRCTLYAGYLQRLVERLPVDAKVVSTERSDPHGTGFPALLFDDRPVQPADGVILAPEDLIQALSETGCPPADLSALTQTLEACLEEFLEGTG